MRLRARGSVPGDVPGDVPENVLRKPPGRFVKTCPERLTSGRPASAGRASSSPSSFPERLPRPERRPNGTPWEHGNPGLAGSPLGTCAPRPSGATTHVPCAPRPARPFWDARLAPRDVPCAPPGALGTIGPELPDERRRYPCGSRLSWRQGRRCQTCVCKLCLAMARTLFGVSGPSHISPPDDG